MIWNACLHIRYQTSWRQPRCVTFILIVHSWRMWQMLYHCLQLKNTFQCTLPGRHPHLQIRRLWQNFPHRTQVKSTWEETSGWPESIQMRDRGMRQSVLCSWKFDISHSDSQQWKTSCMSCWWMWEAIYQSIQVKVTSKISHRGATISLWNWGVVQNSSYLFFAQCLLLQLIICTAVQCSNRILILLATRRMTFIFL